MSVIIKEDYKSIYVVIKKKEFEAAEHSDSRWSYFPCVVLEDNTERLDHYARHKYITIFNHPRNKKGYIIENKFKKDKVLTHEFHICIDYLESNLEKYCVGEVIVVDDYVAVYDCKIKESFRHAIARKEHIIIADVIY